MNTQTNSEALPLTICSASFEEGVEIEMHECDHWKERAEGLLREWVETVQTVDAGVYGDMIDETLQFLQNV